MLELLEISLRKDSENEKGAMRTFEDLMCWSVCLQ